MGINGSLGTLTISGGRFAPYFLRVVVLFLVVFCFVSISFMVPVEAAEAAWQTVVGEGETGSSPSGMVPITTTPTPVPPPQPGLLNEISSLQLRGRVKVYSWLPPGWGLVAGERAIIELELGGSLEQVAGVEIEIDGQVCGVAKNPSRRYYVYDWNIPKTSRKQVKIVSRVRARTGNKVLASYPISVTIKPALAKGACHFWYGVNPAVPGALLQAGERAAIELRVQGAVERIGRVDIEIDGEMHGVASNPSRGHYLLYWEILENTTKHVEIVWRVYPRTGDEVMRVFTKKVAIQPAAAPFKAVLKEFSKKIRRGESKKAIVEVVGGAAPYTYQWRLWINGALQQLPSPVKSDKKTCGYEVGSFDDSVRYIEVEVEVIDFEGEKRSDGVMLYISTTKLQADILWATSSMKTGERGLWRIRCWDNDRTPFSLEFNWGDGTPIAKMSLVEENFSDLYEIVDVNHTYSKSGNYIVCVIVKDKEGATVQITSGIEIIPATLTIVEFIGLEESRVDWPSTFKVKIKPGFESKPPYTYTFFMGDGAIREVFMEYGVEYELVHTYRAAGIYPVRVRVKDNCGFDESNIQVTVTE